MTGYDVFFSFGGHDRPVALALAQALIEGGLRVFADEQIRGAEGITAQIEQELRSSKILLAYYSAGYPSRPACQRELTAAFLAGQRAGDPIARIVVLNPEPGEDHLYPIELADAKFLRPPPAGDRKAMAALVAGVRARVDAVTGTFGEVAFGSGPRWFTERIPGAVAAIGRYREQWHLHTALHQDQYRMIREVTSGPVVALVGLAGAGKSTLAASYAWHFGSMFPGGVYWTSLSGTTAADVLPRYSDELRRVARSLRLDIDVDRTDRNGLAADIADHITVAGRPALWVVDDLPTGLDADTLALLVPLAGSYLRTILISRDGRYGDAVPVVELGRMSPEDAHALLRSHREPDAGDEDTDEVGALAERLGGHPFSLRMAGHRLRDRQGSRSYRDYLRRLRGDPALLDPAIDLVRDALTGLDPTQRFVLQVASVCAPTAIPVRLLTAVATAVRRDGTEPADPGDALVGLRESLLATRDEDRWQVHTIILDAVRRHLAPVLEPAEVARVTADQLRALLGAGDPAPDTLMPHVAALAAHDGLDAAAREALLRLLVGHYQARGEPLLAARHWDTILSDVSRGPGPSQSAEDLLAAAQAQLGAGGYERSIGYARQVLAGAGRPAGDGAGPAGARPGTRCAGAHRGGRPVLG